MWMDQNDSSYKMACWQNQREKDISFPFFFFDSMTIYKIVSLHQNFDFNE